MENHRPPPVPDRQLTNETQKELLEAGGRKAYSSADEVPPDLQKYAAMGYRHVNLGQNRQDRRRMKALARRAKR